MSVLPRKLKRDAIAEAICEVRFECEESSSLPEIVVGRLAEHEMWRDFTKARLPASDIPAPVRSNHPNLKNEPILRLKESNGSRLVKIGVNVLSFHQLAPYPGWARFKPEIDKTLEILFSSFKEFNATRLGFRYINIFTDEAHGVGNVKDLNYSISVAGRDLTEPQNVNYQRFRSDKHTVQIRVASPEFVTSPAKVQVLVDLDVFTPTGVETNDVEKACGWVEDAHTYEKEEFFILFTEDMMQRLVEAE